ncbi:MAG: SMP-30/gluconolactonase/LRE family protein [Ferruginibacter sp.]
MHCFKSGYNLALSCLFLLTTTSFSQQTQSLVAQDTTPTLIASQFKFTEGPAVDKDGNVYFTDQPNNTIWKYGTEGKLSLFSESAGRSNGLYFDMHGNLISCADEKNQLWSINSNGKEAVLLNDFNGHKFNGPNDLWIDRKENIYFTDPYFQRDYWERRKPDAGINGEKLYFLNAKTRTATIADDSLKKPNGVVGSVDGKYLFVSDMGVQKIYKYRIGADGTLLDRQVFAADIADGMTTDNLGNVYLAGKGITVYNAAGNKIQHFNIPSSWTANVCFGGKNRDILFITASESIYILKMKVHGAR